MKKLPLLLPLVVSVLLVSLGYYIDTDPPYESFIHTAFEFTLLTAMIWGFLTSLYMLSGWTFSGISKLFRTNK